MIELFSATKLYLGNISVQQYGNGDEKNSIGILTIGQTFDSESVKKWLAALEDEGLDILEDVDNLVQVPDRKPFSPYAGANLMKLFVCNLRTGEIS